MKKQEQTTKTESVEDRIAGAIGEALRKEVRDVAECLRTAGPVLSPRILTEQAERLRQVAALAERFPALAVNGRAVVLEPAGPSLVHRDVKPDNVLPETAETPKKAPGSPETVELGRKVIRLRKTKTWKETARALRISEPRASYAMRAARAAGEPASSTK